MFSQLRPCLLLFVILTLLTGVVYPLAVTAIAVVAFPHQARGSVIEVDGKAMGSELIGQSFGDPKHFWGRPSATGPVPYNAMGGSGSNQGPTNPALQAAVSERVAKLRELGGDQDKKVPVDLVTTSGSGLDPHISVAAAEYQVPRIARERKLSEDKLQTLIQLHTEQPAFGIFGQPRVHVLRLNLALDALQRNDAKSE